MMTEKKKKEAFNWRECPEGFDSKRWQSWTDAKKKAWWNLIKTSEKLTKKGGEQ